MTEESYKFPYPVPREYDIQRDYYDKGVIPKKDFIDGRWYEGECRNASKAKWVADKNRFEYERWKFGESFTDSIDALEDDRGYDVFLPVRLLED